MKRWLCGLLLLVLLGTGCAAQPYAARRTAVHDRVYQLDETYLSFEDSLSLSTDIVAAEFLGYDEQELYTELAFRVEEVLRGEAQPGETLFVFELPAVVELTDELRYTTGEDDYVPGARYLLVLEREVSVYFAHDRFHLLGNSRIPLTDGAACTRYGQPLSATSALPAEATGLEVEAAVAAACAALPAPEMPARRYTTSDDPDEIAAASEDILVVTTLEALPPGKLNGTQSYRCRVEAVRRGGTAAGETVIVVFFADTVAAGETVLVLANRSHPDSLVYTLSSARSVLPVEGDGGQASFPAA